MLSKQFIQDYFNADFKGINSLLSEVLIPIFQDYEEGYTEITVQTDKAKDMAKAAHIKTIKHVATLGGLAFDIKVFDVTLDDNSRIHKSRKKIQELVRQFVDRFEGAFIVFHYEDPKDRSWRLSYLEKRESNAASTNAKRYTYLCGQQYPCRTLADRFYKLQSEELTAVNLEDAFSVETLSDEFFDEYRYFYQDLVNFVKYENNLLDGFVNYANGDNELAEKYARDYIKKLMGRLVFIQFLQNKAWLNNDIHYTHTLFNRCSEKQKENFLDNVLEPLFFGVFNTPKQEREAYFRSNRWDMKLYEQWKDFPYLNGGLFECDELDQLSLPLPDYFFSNPEKKDHVRTPNDEYYSDACGIFDFFDRYNFTIDESDPLDREVGVDPEMLGKIFENLLEDNKDKGAFYTPKEIVEYMCKEALVAYLVDEARRKSEVNKQRQDNFEEAIRAFVTDPEMTVTRIQRYEDQQLKDLNESLCEVKICDPAIGSGAFPMGLLNLLMNCRVALNNALHKGEPRAWLKKEIIQNNIYGVDIERGAIDIARLRFWLSIVVELEEPEALPNFDYKFMQGNSLLEQYNGVDLSQVVEVQEKSNVGGYQISMFDGVLDVCRKNLHDKLNEYFTVTNHIKKQSLRDEISELVQKELDEQHINVDLSDIDIAANTDFFMWHTWFADVFNRPDKQGFDIVIGNPPYIPLQDNQSLLANLYEDKHFSVYDRGGDIYALFYEQGCNLLKKDGVLCYITSSQWLRAGYGGKLRSYFVNNVNPISLFDFTGVKIFDSATVDTCILLCSRKNYEQNTKAAQTKPYGKEVLPRLREFFVQNSTSCCFCGDDGWIIFPKEEQLLKNKLISVGEPLKTLGIKINYGIKTGCNDAFIIDESTRLNILNSCATEEERQMTSKLIIPVLRGRDIRKHYVEKNGLYQINTHNGVKNLGIPRIDIDKYPSLKNHLDSFYKEITKRSDKGDTPYNLRNCAYLFDIFKEKIIYPETTVRRSEFIYDAEGRMIDKTCFFISGNNLKYIDGLLTSKTIEWYLERECRLLGKTTIQYSKQWMEKIPVPDVSLDQQQPIIDLVDTILAKKKANPVTDTSAEEKAIDKLVYALYGLTPEEIALIENQ